MVPTRTYRAVFGVGRNMSPTVHELRNRIRSSIGRFEREVKAQFTKEELASIVAALGDEPDDGRPSKESMRVAIRRRAEIATGEDVVGDTFRKAELETIAEAIAEA